VLLLDEPLLLLKKKSKKLWPRLILKTKLRQKKSGLQKKVFSLLAKGAKPIID
jgi:hypothetical protein